MKLYVRTLQQVREGLTYDSYINPSSYEFKATGEFVVTDQAGSMYCYAPNTLEGYHSFPEDLEE